MEQFPDADTIDEPLMFATISGGDDGWFHVTVNTTAKTASQAKALAASLIEGIFPGKHKFVRTEPQAESHRDLERGCRIVKGYCRFAFRLEDGITEHARSDSDAADVTYAASGR